MARYEDEPICRTCEKKIELGMPIVSHRGDVLHRWCYEALLRREASEVIRHGDNSRRR